MRAAVITFPGSNCDRDLATAFETAGFDVTRVWHKEAALPDQVDIIGIPGGFSFGDYLRCGAIAANAPICHAIKAHAERGGFVLGICNGFQVLTETGLLPGALIRNAGLKFVCKDVVLRTEESESAFSSALHPGQEITIPVAHHDGNYFAQEAVLDQLEAEGRVAFRYVQSPNGSARDIAGVLSANKRVLGMMPHPERAMSDRQGNADGAQIFAGLIGAMATA